jgi:sortase A
VEVGISRKSANLESVALAATVLIWLGAFFLGVGLVLVYIDLKTQLEIQAVLASSSPSEPIVLAVTMEPTATPVLPTATLPLPTPALSPAVSGTNGPTKEPTPSSTTSPTATPLRWTPTPTPTRAEQTVYVVQGGDSLWEIAESYGITVDALVEANGISKDDVIHPGQELVIPMPGQALPTPLPRSPPPTPTSLPATPTAAPPASTPEPALSPTKGPTSPAPSTRPPPATAPPDRIVAPAISLDAPVVSVGWKTVEENGQEVTEWEVADYAAGWHKTSAYPGSVGNIVIAGHHNIRGEVFRYVVNLEPGAIVDLYAGQTVYRYVVTEKYILREKGMPPEVREENARWIAPTDDERLTLVTCWPYTSNTHRVVVVAKPG